MLKNVISNEKVKIFFENEARVNKVSGTYLFYGMDRELLKKFAKTFAKILNCGVLENDFCDECETCLKIEKEVHVDLEILDDISGVKVEKIRELSYKDSVNSYEGQKRVYIIRDVEKLRKESANALLKLIEEPNAGSFFILLSNSLNILPTIKSRALIIKIDKMSARDLGVSKFEYNFYRGDMKDIEEYKESSIDLKETISYESIGIVLKDWLKEKNIIKKTKIYKAINDFISVKEYLSVADKAYFSDEILSSGLERDEVKFIVDYIVELVSKKSKNLEEILELKMMLKTPINLKNLLVTLLVKI